MATRKTTRKPRENEDAAPRTTRPEAEESLPTNARCDECLFGRNINCEVLHGDTVEIVAKCECHLARPTKTGFPIVRPDDWCSLHVDNYTMERTFGGMAAQNFQ